LKDLQGLQKLNDRVLVVSTQLLESLPGKQGLARVREHCLPHGCVQTVMPKRMLIRDTPQLSRDKFPVSREEALQARDKSSGRIRRRSGRSFGGSYLFGRQS